jgi:hypothetical protein
MEKFYYLPYPWPSYVTTTLTVRNCSGQLMKKCSALSLKMSDWVMKGEIAQKSNIIVKSSKKNFRKYTNKSLMLNT